MRISSQKEIQDLLHLCLQQTDQWDNPQPSNNFVGISAKYFNPNKKYYAGKMYVLCTVSIQHISHKQKKCQMSDMWHIPLSQNDVQRTCQHCEKENRKNDKDITFVI